MCQALRQKICLFMRYFWKIVFLSEKATLRRSPTFLLIFLIFSQWTTVPDDSPRGHHLFHTSLCLPVQAWCAMGWCGELSAVHPHLSARDYSKTFQLTSSWFLDAVIFYTFKYLKERRFLKSSFFIFKLFKFLVVLKITGFSCWF